MLILNGNLDIIFMEIFLLFSFILLNTVFGIYLYKNKLKLNPSWLFFKENYLWYITLLIKTSFIGWLIVLMIYVFITTNIINFAYYDTGRIIIGISIIISIFLSIFFLFKINYKKNIFIVMPLIFSLLFFNTSQLVIDYYKMLSFSITNQDILLNYNENFSKSCDDIIKKRVLVIGIDGIPYNWFYNPVAYPILFDQGTAEKQQTIFKYQYPFYSQYAFESKHGWTSLLTGFDNLNPRKENIFELLHKQKDKIQQSSLVQWDWINNHIVDNDDSFVHKKISNLTNGWRLYESIIGNYNTTKDIINDINSDYHFIFSQFVLGDDMNHWRYPIYSRYCINQNQDLNQKITMLTKLIKKREVDFNENWLIIITTDHGRNNDRFSYDHGDNFSSHQSFFVANKDLRVILSSNPNSQYNLKKIIENYFEI